MIKTDKNSGKKVLRKNTGKQQKQTIKKPPQQNMTLFNIVGSEKKYCMSLCGASLLWKHAGVSDAAGDGRTFQVVGKSKAGHSWMFGESRTLSTGGHSGFCMFLV